MKIIMRLLFCIVVFVFMSIACNREPLFNKAKYGSGFNFGAGKQIYAITWDMGTGVYSLVISNGTSYQTYATNLTNWPRYIHVTDSGRIFIGCSDNEIYTTLPGNYTVWNSTGYLLYSGMMVNAMTSMRNVLFVTDGTSIYRYDTSWSTLNYTGPPATPTFNNLQYAEAWGRTYAIGDGEGTAYIFEIDNLSVNPLIPAFTPSNFGGIAYINRWEDFYIGNNNDILAGPFPVGTDFDGIFPGTLTPKSWLVTGDRHAFCIAIDSLASPAFADIYISTNNSAFQQNPSGIHLTEDASVLSTGAFLMESFSGGTVAIAVCHTNASPGMYLYNYTGNFLRTVPGFEGTPNVQIFCVR